MEVVGDSEDPFEAIDFVSKNDVDILILDINLPNKSGLEVLKELKIFKPEIKTLMLSMHPEDRYAIRCLKAGAWGYISKDSDLEIIINAVHKISQGRKYVSERLAEQMALEVDMISQKKLHKSLSDRELEVLLLFVNGKGQTDIAEQLNLSISTINTYRSRIFQKLNIKSIAELTRYAIENKLIE
jgi:DNA-binding NarL/FixJ family response regulator